MLKVDTPKPASSLAAKDFSVRLDALMEAAGYRKHGRLTAISRMTGLTVGSVRLFYVEDRPPKNETLAQLIEHLVKELNQTEKHAVSSADVRSYLLDGKEIASLNASIASKTAITQITIDPIYASQVILAIHAIAKTMDIDLQSGSMLIKNHLIESRLIRYCTINKPDLASKEFQTIVTSMLNIAQSTDDLTFLS
jgi:hypothetical protein